MNKWYRFYLWAFALICLFLFPYTLVPGGLEYSILLLSVGGTIASGMTVNWIATNRKPKVKKVKIKKMMRRWKKNEEI